MDIKGGGMTASKRLSDHERCRILRSGLPPSHLVIWRTCGFDSQGAVVGAGSAKAARRIFKERLWISLASAAATAHHIEMGLF